MRSLEHVVQMVGELFLRAPEVAEVGAYAGEFGIQSVGESEFAQAYHDVVRHNRRATRMVEVGFHFGCGGILVQGFLFYCDGGRQDWCCMLPPL